MRGPVKRPRLQAGTESQILTSREVLSEGVVSLSDGILRNKDAVAGETPGPRDAGVAGNGVAQRPVNRRVLRVDADPGGNHGFADWEPILANLERRTGRGQVQSVVAGPYDRHRLAQTARARREL